MVLIPREDAGLIGELVRTSLLVITLAGLLLGLAYASFHIQTQQACAKNRRTIVYGEQNCFAGIPSCPLPCPQ